MSFGEEMMTWRGWRVDMVCPKGILSRGRRKQISTRGKEIIIIM